MDRREAIRRIAGLLGGVSSPTLAGLLAGCEAPPPGRSEDRGALTPRQRSRIGAIAEIIIPETDTPGAGEACVPEFIEEMLTGYYPDAVREQFLRELDRVAQIAFETVDVDFEEATEAQRITVLEVLDAEAWPDPEQEPALARQVAERMAAGDPPFMRTMKELTLAGYYTSEGGQTLELRIPPLGPYLGDIPVDQVERAWA